MKFVDARIADAERRLDDINRKIEELKTEAISVRGELRAYQVVRENELAGASAEVRSASSEQTLHSEERTALKSVGIPATSEPERIGFSRLKPVWRALFTEMVKSYPKAFTQDELAEIAIANKLELGPSFRTALWHHAVRHNLERQFDGTFVANETTAEKAGVRWTGVKVDSQVSETHHEATPPRLRAPPGTVKPTLLRLIKESNGLSIAELVQKTGFKIASTRATLWTLRDEGDVESREGRWFATESGRSRENRSLDHQVKN